MSTSESVTPTSSVCDVWKHNVGKELRRLSKFAWFYNIISIHTEYLPILPVQQAVSEVSNAVQSFELITSIVKGTKLVLLEVSISDEHGDTIIDGGTWRFNFRLNTDINMYMNYVRRPHLHRRICHELHYLRDNGIPYGLFFKGLEISGLLRHPELRWVSYNGLCAFGFIVKHLYGNRGLQSARVFQELLQTDFPRRYDIKVLSLGYTNFPGDGDLPTQQTESTSDRTELGLSDSTEVRDVFVNLLANKNLTWRIASQNGVLFGTPRFYYSQLTRTKDAQ